jgi:hypothetical protein
MPKKSYYIPVASKDFDPGRIVYIEEEDKERCKFQETITYVKYIYPDDVISQKPRNLVFNTTEKIAYHFDDFLRLSHPDDVKDEADTAFISIIESLQSKFGFIDSVDVLVDPLNTKIYVKAIPISVIPIESLKNTTVIAMSKMRLSHVVVSPSESACAVFKIIHLLISEP